jgi:hypothetical protein
VALPIHPVPLQEVHFMAAKAAPVMAASATAVMMSFFMVCC